MAGQSLRNFSASARRHVLQLLGRVSLEDVVRNNGSSGETWAHSVKSVAEKVEDQVRRLRELPSRMVLNMRRYSILLLPATKFSKCTGERTTIRSNLEDSYTEDIRDNCRGAKAHKSSKDPDDPDDVITLAFYTARGQRMLSGHVHENGTFKLAESRLGRKSKKK
jgi:hypothetical protein